MNLTLAVLNIKKMHFVGGSDLLVDDKQYTVKNFFFEVDHWSMFYKKTFKIFFILIKCVTCHFFVIICEIY